MVFRLVKTTLLCCSCVLRTNEKLCASFLIVPKGKPLGLSGKIKKLYRYCKKRGKLNFPLLDKLFSYSQFFNNSTISNDIFLY